MLIAQDYNKFHWRIAQQISCNILKPTCTVKLAHAVTWDYAKFCRHITRFHSLIGGIWNWQHILLMNMQDFFYFLIQILKFLPFSQHIKMCTWNFKLNQYSFLYRQAIMVGDDIVNDVGGAQACGITGLQVRTGKFRYVCLQI